MNQDSGPDNQRLSAILRQARPSPECPPGLRAAVWRRIHQQELPTEVPGLLTFLDNLVDRLLRPRLAFACLLILLLVGGVSGALIGGSDAKQLALQRYVAAVAPNPLR